MEVTREDLQATYRDLVDEELVRLLQSGTLTELAVEVAEGELRERSIVPPPPPEPESAEAEDDTQSPDILVTVARFSKPMEAQILRMRLEADGIPAVIADENTIRVNWFLSNALGGVRVQVPSRKLQEAHEVMAALRAGRLRADEGEVGG